MQATDPVSEAGPDTSEGWSLGQQFMLRVAGLPVETVQGLRCPGSCTWAARVLDEEARLGALGRELSDRLHPLIGQTEDERRRHELLLLRRKLFNNRLPGDLSVLTTLDAGTDSGLPSEIARWAADWAELSAFRARGAEVVAADVVRTRAELRGLVGEERLLKGLQLASPTLADKLPAFARQHPNQPPDKRQRKIERSVLAYLYRMTHKTSPFSTFTGVALGAFYTPDRTGARDLDFLRIADEWTSHARLNIGVLARLAELILADAERRSDLPVSLAPSWGQNDERIRYVRRSVALGDTTAAVTLDTAWERVFFLRRSGTLDRLIRLFEERSSIRYQEISDWLCEDQQAEPAECERYLSALVLLGMVQVPCLAIDVHTADPARQFQGALRALDRSWADSLAAALDGPISCLDHYPAADSAQRRRLLAELRSGLQAVQRELGDVTATLPQTILYEDVRAGSETVAYDLPERVKGDDGLLDSLRPLERLLSAVDVTLTPRLTFKGFFLARYGRGATCDDVLKLVQEFHEDLFDQYLTVSNRRHNFDERGECVPEVNWLHLPEIAAVDRVRRAFVDHMRRLWQEHGDHEEIRLSKRSIAEITDQLGNAVDDFMPRTHFVQVVRRAGDPHVVLNQSYGSLAFPFSRFTHCFDGPAAGPREELSAQLRRATAAAQPAGAVFAELTGGFATTNLNLHGRLTEYEIVTTDDTSSVPEEYRITLDDLVIEHDQADDRLVLRSRRLGREVVPVYFGYLLARILPKIPRTLLLLAPAWMAPLNVWGGVPGSERADGVTVRPRVRYGNVVLSRRLWQARASALPSRRPGSTDEEWFLDWQRWRRTHGVPERAYATVTAPQDGPAARGKPQFVDFASYLALTMLDGLLTSPNVLVVLQEALPDEDGLVARSDRGFHVVELAVETLTARRPRPTPHPHVEPAGRSGDALGGAG